MMDTLEDNEVQVNRIKQHGGMLQLVDFESLCWFQYLLKLLLQCNEIRSLFSRVCILHSSEFYKKWKQN